MRSFLDDTNDYISELEHDVEKWKGLCNIWMNRSRECEKQMEELKRLHETDMREAWGGALMSIIAEGVYRLERTFDQWLEQRKERIIREQNK